MFRISRSRPWPPDIDLSTVRETIAYMSDDMRRVPELGRVQEALRSVLSEIDAVERRQQPVRLSPFAARFMPRR